MTHSSLDWYDHHNVPYMTYPGKWEGPLWTGYQMILSEYDAWGDPAWFHELCHFLAADPTQWPYPDLALDRVTNSHGEPVAIYGLNRFSDYGDLGRGWAGEACIDPLEAGRQEGLACDMMFFYEGLVEDNWEPEGFNSAAYEFSGNNCFWDEPERVEACWDFIVQWFYPEMDRDTFDGYVSLLRLDNS